jgi:hypothetical protein
MMYKTTYYEILESLLLKKRSIFNFFSDLKNQSNNRVYAGGEF